MLDAPGTSDPTNVDEVVAGLRRKQKTLPAKFFYDAEGCRLFGEITRLPEYYVTRTEAKLLAAIVPELPEVPGSALVEYGGSDEAKAVMILDRIAATAYVPIDVAGEALQRLAQRLGVSRPGLLVQPLVADFLQSFALPPAVAGQPKFGFFPGSTIGNLDPEAAGLFLSQARRTLGPNANFLVGVDLRKDAAVLLPAYDDPQGVTAAFNRNLLVHLNRITLADFEPNAFTHRAVWNATASRIEMHLVSDRPQVVHLAGQDFAFAAGETIHTESSYKHTVQSFLAIAQPSGWASKALWQDDAGLFSLHLLHSPDL